MRARRLDPLRPRREHARGERLGVTALHLRHAGAHRVAGQAPPDEDDEAVEARDAVPPVGEGVDRELELLVSLDGGGHARNVASPSRESTDRASAEGPRFLRVRTLYGRGTATGGLP